MKNGIACVKASTEGPALPCPLLFARIHTSAARRPHSKRGRKACARVVARQVSLGHVIKRSKRSILLQPSESGTA
eukprot:7149202-Prymnesium_polylepis.1